MLQTRPLRGLFRRWRFLDGKTTIVQIADADSALKLNEYHVCDDASPIEIEIK